MSTTPEVTEDDIRDLVSVTLTYECPNCITSISKQADDSVDSMEDALHNLVTAINDAGWETGEVQGSEGVFCPDCLGIPAEDDN